MKNSVDYTFQLNALELQLCDLQGRLFELSLKKDLNSPSFIKAFMTSKTAAALDNDYNRLQWLGEEYILDRLTNETGGLKTAGKTYPNEVMYWIGFTYRYWRFLANETSTEIYQTADAKTMNDCWPCYHTLDVKMAIDNLKENHALKQSLKQSAVD